VLREAPPQGFLNLGCAVRDGAFEARLTKRAVEVKTSTGETSLIFFVLRLLDRLQKMGTAPAIDLMKYGERLARKGERFDVIILDPPTFSRSRTGKAWQVEHDFERLLMSALEVAERDAKILLSTNCTRLDERALEVMARFCLKATRRAGTLVPSLRLPDFPPGAAARSLWAILR